MKDIHEKMFGVVMYLVALLPLFIIHTIAPFDTSNNTHIYLLHTLHTLHTIVLLTGTHWVKSAVMGGEVEVTTMVRKEKKEEKASDSKTVEANVEHALDTQEAEDDSESKSESVVETNTGGSATTAGIQSHTSGSGSEDQITDGESISGSSSASTAGGSTTNPAKHSIVKGETKHKNALQNMGEVLGNLAQAAASGISGGIIPLIKTAIQNLELKLAVSSSQSSSSATRLTKENNKNEVKFSGGDTSIDPNSAGGMGGMSFDSWKDSIKTDPAPVSKTMAPITELMVQFAGPNAGERKCNLLT